MFDRLTDRARKVMGLARQESQRHHHGVIAPEHVLLAIAKEGTGVAAEVMGALAVDPRQIVEEVEKRFAPGGGVGNTGVVPFSPRTKQVLERSLEEARDLDHPYVGTEHLLLAILRANEGVAARVLRALGMTVDAVRDQIVRILGPEAPEASEAPASGAPKPPCPELEHDRIRWCTDDVLDLVQRARKAARRFQHAAVDTEHLLFALATQPQGGGVALLRHFDVEPARIRDELWMRIGPPVAADSKDLPPFGPRAKRVVALALDEASALGHDTLDTAHVLLGLLVEGDGIAARALLALGLEAGDLRSAVAERLEARTRPPPTPQRKTPALDAFTTDAAKREPGLPVPLLVGREAVLERVLAVLHRQRHRNVALVGPPGVGKTALVDELARRMAAGDRVGRFAGHRLLRLDIAMLVAGTKYRGQLEERARAIVTEVRRAGDVVLHVEEPEALSSNGYQGESMTVAEALAPIARGDVGVLIMTATPDVAGPTLEHLRLAHLYSRVEVPEPEPTAARAMVAAHREVLATHHDVELTDDALDVAIAGGLTLVNRHLPSSALDLLDETCARVARFPRATRKPVVDAAAVRATLATYRAPEP